MRLQLQQPIQPNHQTTHTPPLPPPPPPPPITSNSTTTTTISNTITDLPLPLSQVPIQQSQLPPPVPPVQLPPVPNPLVSLNHSVLPPVELQGALSTASSEANSNTNAKSGTCQFKINPREFELFDSTPFDDALLRSIDEQKELNLVFGGGNNNNNNNNTSANSVHR